MSDPLLKSEIHAETNTGTLATGYDSRIQTYITGQGTPFASGYAKNHILRDLNRRLYNYGLESSISDSHGVGFRSTTLTGILAAGGGGGGGGGSSAPFAIHYVFGTPQVVLVASGTTNSTSIGYHYGQPVPVYDTVNF